MRSHNESFSRREDTDENFAMQASFNIDDTPKDHHGSPNFFDKVYIETPKNNEF